MIRSQDRQITGSPTTGSPNHRIPESPNHQITETSGSPNHRTASPDPRIKPRIPGPPINKHPDHRSTKSLDHQNTGSPDHLITTRSLRGPCISTAKRKTLSNVKSERLVLRNRYTRSSSAPCCDQVAHAASAKAWEPWWRR